MLIKPSHYDNDGYVISWFRSAMPSNSLAVLYALATDCRDRRVLGPDVGIEISAIDETNTRVRINSIIRRLRGRRALIGLVGVQSNQYPRAFDLARRFRAAGIPVALGGFHVSGTLSMLDGIQPELRQAMDIGVSLFAGEAEGRFDQVLQDAWNGALKPLYNFMDDLPPLSSVPTPMLPATRIKRTGGTITSFDAGRGCPFKCSFCTIINVQGRKSRRRTAEECEEIVRRNLAQGINRFFITDDNFARNLDWEKIFDRFIHMREVEGANIKFIIQVDTMCHRLPHFIEKAGRAGVARVFIGLESVNPDSLKSANKKQNKIAEYRKMLLEWKKAKVTVFAGYILGFPGETPESIRRDIGIIQRELPIDLLEFHCLTPLPGSEDHQRLFRNGTYLDPDLNKYDLEHICTTHPNMTVAEWQRAYDSAWDLYYSPDHIRTVMRRAAATGINAGNMLFLLLWYWTCEKLEHVHPLQGGYLRRKFRHDRRPELPVESPLVFYPRYVYELVSKHVHMGAQILRFLPFRYQLKRDSESTRYRDVALTPVEEEDASTLEVLRVLTL